MIYSKFCLDKDSNGKDFYRKVQHYLIRSFTEPPTDSDLRDPHFIPKAKTGDYICGAVLDCGEGKELKVFLRGKDLYNIIVRVGNDNDHLIYCNRKAGSPSFNLPENYSHLMSDAEILACHIGHPEFRAAAMFFYKYADRYRNNATLDVLKMSYKEKEMAKKYYFVLCFCICEGARFKPVNYFVQNNIKHAESKPITIELLKLIRDWKGKTIQYNGYYADKEKNRHLLKDIRKCLRIAKNTD